MQSRLGPLSLLPVVLCRLPWVLALAAALRLCLAPGPLPAAHAYIPAQATNDSEVAARAGLNFSDVSSLSLLWYPMGSYSGRISYQLVGADSAGISKVCALSCCLCSCCSSFA